MSTVLNILGEIQLLGKRAKGDFEGLDQLQGYRLCRPAGLGSRKCTHHAS